MGDEVANGDEVVYTSCHDSQRIQIEADDVREDPTAQIAFAVANCLAVAVVPIADATDGQHQERPGATGRVEQALVGVALVA